MRVYQAAWDVSGELVIWGERASTFNDLIYRNQNLEQFENIESPVHPFACSPEQIEEDLALVEFVADNFKTVEVLLPSDAAGPLPSPQLVVANEVDRDSSPVLRNWRIPAATFAPYPSANFLTSLPQEAPIGIKFSDSVRFWLEATKFVLELLCLGRFIPTTVQHLNQINSYWQIVPKDDFEQKHFLTLSECLPPICLGYVQKDSGKAFEASDLIESYISCLGDALIRTFLANYSLVPHLGARFPSLKLLTVQEWLKSLTSSSPIIEAPNLELITLDQKIRQWNSRLLSSIKKVDLKTGFELNTPDPSAVNFKKSSQVKWRIDFFIFQATDKSRRLYPYQIWAGELGFLKNSEFTSEQLEEIFLKDLGKASSVFPELKQALFQSYPGSVTLETEDVYRFLKVTSLILEQAGFEVFLPDWWKNSLTKIGLHLSIVPPADITKTKSSQSFLGINELLDCSWSIILGNKKLTINDFKKLVSNNSSLLAVEGSWVELNPEKIASTIAFLENAEKNHKMTVLEALRLGYGVQSDESILPVVGFSAEGWIKQLIDATAEGLPAITQPQSFIGTLRHYQLDGLSWLSFLSNLGIGCCLADDMGLGKTIQFLALLLREREQFENNSIARAIEPTLLIVPMSILDNWLNEASRFSPTLKTYLHHGTDRLTGEAFLEKAKNVDLVLTTYSLAYRDEEIISAVAWARITLDEAQNIKNLGTKQTQAIRRLVYAQLHNMERTTVCQRMALTGTPLENHLEELWSIIDFLNPSYLGTLRSFRSIFAIPIERYRNKEAAKSLTKVIRPFVLRRLKTDPKVITDLPEKIEMIEYTGLTEEQAALYQQAVESLLPEVEQASGIHRKGLVLAIITKLKQICNHPALVLEQQKTMPQRSGKLNRLEELLETILEADDKVLIFTQFAQMGGLLKAHLQERFGQEILFLHGGLTKSSRVKLVEKFQQKTGPKVFILSLKAGGFGLNLTEANQVIHYDQWWNPAVEDQATDRAFRIGQKRNVQVRKFICKGTLEEKIAEMLKSKRGLADQIIGATKNIITELSGEELRELLQLTQQSIINENE